MAKYKEAYAQVVIKTSDIKLDLRLIPEKKTSENKSN
jgi:hypothetical protein